jgi:tripartite-type tricarboxylate transporter receptor subunit TctC
MNIARAGIAFLATALFWTAPTLAQTYPDRVIKVVVGAAAGGGLDVVRAVAQELTTRWGKSVNCPSSPVAPLVQCSGAAK